MMGSGGRSQGSGVRTNSGRHPQPRQRWSLAPDSRPLAPGRRQAGFTLLEVLVSVVILGTTMVAVLQLYGSTVALAAKAEAMATAARLAKNRMIDLTKAGVPAVDTSEGEYEEPELSRFTWAERIEESPYSTRLVKVYEIVVEVAWGKGPDQVVRVRTYRLK